jgi:RAB6A-GEF complex partner protein 1
MCFCSVLRHVALSLYKLNIFFFSTQTCLSSQRLRTAGSYLLVLHSLEQLDTGHADAFRLLRGAVAAKDWQLCRELLRFLHSMDDSGAVLKEALAQPFMIEAQV